MGRGGLDVPLQVRTIGDILLDLAELYIQHQTVHGLTADLLDGLVAQQLRVLRCPRLRL